ncbi:DedA family protein [Glaesserella parasuis]|uniref:YqaA family protein n=1 Tax=Glaesserella parasuis TaxID=738 RepID=UPI0013660485|nr:YqaA family protein [Glaesserella parasuis]MDG6409042.1 DedA family protein [Glaesserella parasuis]MDG6449479.1 DedA family protein [Glaesserella parasuis]MDO9779997.1 YqaA family protein [Glaesserella parasuis]MDO9790472.1 YqaA family protein [Glaesserella parasuis]MDO9826093.1 YqaA family protein [Glaesserella parasuis]
MSDYLTALLGIFLSEENQLLIMFVSSFLSATILPGNSEVIFTTYTTQALLQKNTVYGLFVVATLGNSLGSMTTYFIAQFFPQPKFYDQQHKSIKLALKLSQKYGIWILLFSWFPIVGDIFCGIAGWLRFNLWKSILLITLGKGIRYALLLWSVYLVVS